MTDKSYMTDTKYQKISQYMHMFANKKFNVKSFDRILYYPFLLKMLSRYKDTWKDVTEFAQRQLFSW